MEKAEDTLQSLRTCEVNFVKEDPILALITETKPDWYGGCVPIPRTKGIDERTFHESKSKLPLSLDVLDVKGPELLFKLVPICSGWVLIHLFHSLLLSWSLLVTAAEKLTACPSLRRTQRDSPRFINGLRAQFLFRNFDGFCPQGNSPLPPSL